MKVLFICTGNTCRSVMAQFLLEKLCRSKGVRGWEARSCGIAAESAFPIPKEVRNALAERGISRVEHTPAPVSRELLEWADLALGMTKMHRDFLTDQYPELRGKIRLFLDYALSQSEDVEDPIGQPKEVYSNCRDVIERGLEAILNRHATKTP